MRLLHVAESNIVLFDRPRAQLCDVCHDRRDYRASTGGRSAQASACAAATRGLKPPRYGEKEKPSGTMENGRTKESPRQESGTDWMFYDGHCGLCHRSVRFVLARDRRNRPFQFAPLDGEVFRRALPEADRIRLPDSIVVVTSDGVILTRSAAMLHIGTQLGGIWRQLAAVGRFFPRVVRDAAYDVVARIRLRLFARPADVCPLVAPHLRSRFGR
jgi:predicted DCC family thiol-disulfide oxidoreductase YuxK